ncbi:hypothetical protein AMTRI_Chr13g118760 [Amborella trichopoda]
MLKAVEQLEAAKYKKHKQKTVYNLKLPSDLSFIRNISVHFNDLQLEIKVMDTFNIFPELLMEMHRFAYQQIYHKEDQFKIFFGKAMT